MPHILQRIIFEGVERGAYDYLLKVRACDMKQYQQFILNKLGEIDSVASIESTFVMSEIKQNYGINF